ncbi:hypothetical protein D6779_02010 [Candidatus Parcubacteria bacterium]|nr:MAG: hypothetical protein D6779_02010 [Candidatus Parcubacteria bacterium]
MTQLGALQIKAVLFEIAKHFFDPHPVAIITQRHLAVRQIDSQTPDFFFASLPMGKRLVG